MRKQPSPDASKETGAVTGVDQMGRGATVVDFLLTLDIMLSAVFIIKGNFDCRRSPDPYCAMKNTAWGMLSFVGFAGLARISHPSSAEGCCGRERGGFLTARGQ
jgi:hypothetical protein